MNPLDIFRMAWQSLWQRKLATFLNLIGITVGASILLLAIAGLSGVEDTFRTLFESSEFAREVEVRPALFKTAAFPDKFRPLMEEVPMDRREAIKKILSKAWTYSQRRNTKYYLTPKDIEKCKTIQGATRVVPEIFSICRINESADWMRPREELEWMAKRTYLGSLDVDQRTTQNQVICGQLPDETTRNESVMISEILAYRMGFFTKSDLESLIGKEIEVFYAQSTSSPSQMLSVISGGRTLTENDRVRLLSIVTKAKKSSLGLTQQEELILKNIQAMLLPVPDQSKVDIKYKKSRKFRIAAVLQFEEKVASVSQMFRRFKHAARC